MDIGEIFISSSKKTKHPFVFLSNKDDEKFYACMITHARRHPNNIPFLPSHFKSSDELGFPFTVVFDNSNLVKLQLEKNHGWGTFIKVGELTQEGIDFLINQLDDADKTTWRVYKSGISA